MEYNKDDIKFWIEVKSKDNVQIEIEISRFIKFLTQKGFCKLYLDNNNSILIRIKDNIVSETNRERIKDFVSNYINNAPHNLTEGSNNTELFRTLIKGSNYYFSKNILEFLEEVEPDILKDTIEHSYFFFRNCFAKVSAYEITIHNYSELKSPVWENQIIDRDFYINNDVSDFEVFMQHVFRNDPHRFKSLQSAIGYLLNSYKDPTVTKAIIILDENLSGIPDGRNGKSRIGEAIGKLKRTVLINGKQVNFKERFVYQEVNLDTQVINFNDVNSNFNFETLFSVITEGITVEKKGQKSFTIPFKESPKILISTNYVIKGEGKSFKGRMFEIEFSDYYSDNFMPIMEFGRRFYDDWNQDDWNSFYTFMIKCTQLYLSEGLIPYKHINLGRKKLELMTSKDFCEFADKIERGKEFDKKELFEKLKSESLLFPYHQRTFNNYLHIYCRANKINIVERQSAGKTLITLKDDLQVFDME